MDAIVTSRAADLVVIGQSSRMTPQTAAQTIPAAWQRFLADPPATHLAQPALDPFVYAVYCDYEADHRRGYTMVLGVAVPVDTAVPDGLRRVTVPSGRYSQFAVQGDPAQVVWRTWAEINERWALRHERRYLADYERYDPGRMFPQHVEAEIVLGLR